MRLPGTAKVAGREWSVQQRAIFEAFRSAPGHVLVRARAGTGKTTTILEALQYAPESKILLGAFNKQIADELQTRVSDPGECEDAPCAGDGVYQGTGG